MRSSISLLLVFDILAYKASSICSQRRAPTPSRPLAAIRFDSSPRPWAQAQVDDSLHILENLPSISWVITTLQLRMNGSGKPSTSKSASERLSPPTLPPEAPACGGAGARARSSTEIIRLVRNSGDQVLTNSRDGMVDRYEVMSSPSRSLDHRK